MIPGKVYGQEEIWAVAKRRKWLILLPMLVVSVTTLLAARMLPNRYRAETLILVVPQRVPESYVKSTVTAPIEDRLRSISQQILSRSRLERIIQDLNLYADLRRTIIMEDVVARMRRDIEVETVKGDAFRVAFVGDDPRTVAEVTQRLASLFIEENLKDREVLADGSYEFIDSQLEESRGQLLDQEKKLEEYSRKFDGQLPTQLQWNLQMIQSLQTQVRSIDEATAREHERRLVVQQSIADLTAVDGSSQSAASPAGVSNDPAPGTAAQQLLAAQQQLQQMQLRLKPEHPDVVALKKTIQRLAQVAEQQQMEAALAPRQQPSVSPQERAKQNRLKELNGELADLDRRLQDQSDEEQRLRDAITGYQGRVEATPTRSTELVELTRDYDTLQQTYRNLLSKKYDAKVAANLEKRQVGEQFKVLDAARVPEKPYSPDRFRISLLGISFGVCLGLGLAGLTEYADSTFKTDDDVFGALSLPVLALVPMIATSSEQRKRRIWLRVAAASSAAILLLATAFGVWKLGS